MRRRDQVILHHDHATIFFAQTGHTIDDGAGQPEVSFALDDGDRLEAGNALDIRSNLRYRLACRFISGCIGKYMDRSLIGEHVCQQCLYRLLGVTGAVIDE